MPPFRRFAIWAAVAIVLLLAALTRGREDARVSRLAREQAVLRQEMAAVEARWVESSLSWLREPSGLSVSGLAKDGSPLLVAVDDEQSGVFVLRPSKAGAGIVRLLRFDDATDLRDLEGITYVPDEDLYLAIGSHRQLGPAGSRYRQLTTFSIDAAAWEQPEYRLRVVETIDLTVDARPSLQAYLAEHGVHVGRRKWTSGTGDPRQPYELEIEGLAFRAGIVYLGLKWPLAGGDGILLKYSRRDRRFVSFERLPLGGYGISALSFAADRLLVAANPPGQGQAGLCTAPYGRSRLYEDGANGLVELRLGPLGVASECGKLEGVAATEDYVVFAHDQGRRSLMTSPAGVLRAPPVVHTAATSSMPATR
jgi:hypothetical protein